MQEQIPASKHPIVLIGPVRAGKSTIGKLLAQRLAWQSVSLDDHCVRYSEDSGIEVAAPAVEQRARWVNDHKWLGLFKSTQSLNALIVKRFLSDHDHREMVIDFGAGHSVYDPPLLDEISTLLRPYDNVILLLPAPDPQESARILRSRLEYPMHIALNPYFINHRANAMLAKRTVYTEGKTPLQTCEEILEMAKAPKAKATAP